MKTIWILLAAGAVVPQIQQGCEAEDADADGWTTADGDCDDRDDTVHPGATEVCDEIDNNCDGNIDDVDVDGDGDLPIACGGEDCSDTDASTLECTLQYGGHRIERNGEYFYALYNDQGFGILGQSDWYGSQDSSSSPEGVTWNEDQTTFFYNDLAGNVFMQQEPFKSLSTLIGTFNVGQIGGGVYFNGTYFVGDYNGGNIYAMDITTGQTSLYASLGTSACKPYFGNSAMAIDVDGRVFAASSCGITVYTPGGNAKQLNSYSSLMSMVAMDADQELYSMDYSGKILHFSKTSGEVLGSVTVAYPPSTTWTMAVDSNGDFVINYWGEQRLFSHTDGSLIYEWSAADYYPAPSGYYWYVTF